MLCVHSSALLVHTHAQTVTLIRENRFATTKTHTHTHTHTQTDTDTHTHTHRHTHAHTHKQTHTHTHTHRHTHAHTHKQTQTHTHTRTHTHAHTHKQTHTHTHTHTHTRRKQKTNLSRKSRLRHNLDQHASSSSPRGSPKLQISSTHCVVVWSPQPRDSLAQPSARTSRAPRAAPARSPGQLRHALPGGAARTGGRRLLPPGGSGGGGGAVRSADQHLSTHLRLKLLRV